MLKYRVEFKKSRLLVMCQLMSCACLISTVLAWQPEVFKYSFLLQALFIFIVIVYFFKVILFRSYGNHVPVIFSECGEWMETDLDKQISWKVTDKSRASGFLIFIHLSSAANHCHSKWCLVYKDQVSEKDYRRICRAVMYQQQAFRKNDK